MTPILLADKAEFQRWADSPATVEFLSYLRERQLHLMQAWGRGLALTVEQQAQAVLLGQLAELTWEDLAQQYRWEVSSDAG